MKHLLITGQSGRGKTWLVQHLMAAFGFSIAGFETFPEAALGFPRHFFIKSLKRQQGQVERQLIATVQGPGQYHIWPEGFRRLGLKSLDFAQLSDAECIVMDELGRFEQDIPEFTQKVCQVLDQKQKQVIAVLKAEPLEWLLAIRQRTDCVLIDLDTVSREEAWQMAVKALMDNGRFLHLIVMAAGQSSRYGENKLLVPVDGQPMFQHILKHLAVFQQSHPNTCQVVVVTRFPEIVEAAEKNGMSVSVNNQPELGISQTIRIGLLAAEQAIENRGVDQSRAAVFFTADQPFLLKKTIEQFLFHAAVTAAGILSVRQADTPGNPVSFDQHYFADLLALTGDQGGRAVLMQHPESAGWHNVSAAELQDIDRPNH